MFRSKYYVLDDDGVPLPCDDVIVWGTWFESAKNRTVAKDEIGEAQISTVFLGLDHNFGVGPPLLYETMIFDGPHDGYQTRYSTRDEALVGHQKAVALVRSAQHIR